MLEVWVGLSHVSESVTREWVCHTFSPWASEVAVSFDWARDGMGCVRRSVSCAETLVSHNSMDYLKCKAKWQVLCFMMKNVQSLWYSKLRSLTAATRSHATNQITRHKPGYTGQIRNQTWPPGTARRSRLRRDASFVLATFVHITNISLVTDPYF